jgi:AbrB family looped-hinge helix DNA binding protein
MDSKITIDQAGRILIPKALRQELHLGAGDVLALSSDGEEIRLHPVRQKAMVKKEKGVWVYQGDPAEASSITGLIDREREKRLRELMG